MTIEDTEGRLSVAAGKAMRQNKMSRLSVEAMANPRVTFRPKGLGCFFGKPGLAEPSIRSARALVCRFSILAFLQKCVRQYGRVGLLVRPIFCAESTQGLPWDVRWAAAGEAGCAL